MKLKSLFGTVLAVGLLLPLTAETAELKIGLVDVRSAIENTNAYQQGLNRLKALTSKKQKELDALRMKIEQAEKDVLGQSMAMSPERLSQKQSEINDRRKQYSRQQQDAQEEIVAAQSKLQSAQGIKLTKVLQEFGKKHGYDIILPKAQFVLYSNPAHDVTAEITKLLDK
jgi:outer membrane protein